MDLSDHSIDELGAMLRRRDISSVELTEAMLNRIGDQDEQLGAFVTVCKESAMRDAEDADKLFRRNENVTPLMGIPFSLKDCFCTRGIKTTCSSRILEEFVPPYDASVVESLKNAGSVLLGKNNMDEFGMGSSCENSAFFPARNPWDLSRVPGGSSGGSAVAVASGMSVFSIGEDTGGSIRMPAAFCGVTGLKPTYGRVSRFGQIALASSFDSIGPIARSTKDVAIVFGCLAKHDPRDSTSLRDPAQDYLREIDSGIRDLRVGVPKEYFGEGVDPRIRASVRDAIEHFRSLGAKIQDVSIEHTKYAIPVYYILLFAESSANLARFDGVRFGLSVPETARTIEDLFCNTRTDGFGTEVKRRIMLGTFVLSSGYYDAYYGLAQKVRTLIKQDFQHVFSQVDVLVTPVCPSLPFVSGEMVDDPLAMYLSDIYVTPDNIAGIPSLSVPCGSADGLPIGLQIHGPKLSEPTLFRVGNAFQNTTQWHLARPNLKS